MNIQPEVLGGLQLISNGQSIYFFKGIITFSNYNTLMASIEYQDITSIELNQSVLTIISINRSFRIQLNQEAIDTIHACISFHRDDIIDSILKDPQ